ncbi:protein-glutamate O-methyltransferase CheR [Novosphingobium sp. AAP83]|uniref:CheR family methyltransferase n=1 Tax=Novosphingobium sp. AAP83 TaxID=1523425 RepID=UPI001E2CB56E|nr:CheR family methyltransferase [Novosphingobium sp. AAP83]
MDETTRISERNFKRLAAFVQAQTGIKMPPSKRTLVEGRLMRCLRQSGVASVDEYCNLVLDGQAGDEETLRLINAITTNKTDFFREPGHFDAMRNLILPAFVANGVNRARCWSAASSTGMEAYSMAMVLDDFAQGTRGFDYEVLATDIDTNVLAEAQRGVYPLAALEPVPPTLRTRYVQRALDPARAEARIVPALRRKLSFGRMNLMDEHYGVGGEMDLIFCRNVLIYFEKDVQAQVVRRLCDVLRPGGFLVLGHSESITGLNLSLTTVATTVFRK